MTALMKPTETLLCKDPLIFIDTRSPEAYAASHIPGAIHMRDIFNYVSTSNTDGLAALQGKFATLFGDAGLSGKERAIIYEDAMDTGNGQSCRGYFLLKYLGYPKASVLHGGFQAWLASGLPTTDRQSFPTPTAFPLAVNSSLMATKEHVLDALKDERVAILDVRDTDEWCGNYTTPSGMNTEMRPGRIPGAVWLEWRKMLDPSATPAMFRSKEEIVSILAEEGITPSTPIHIYCFKGSRAASTYVALEMAGFKNVRNYFASWNEWGRDDTLPIDETQLADDSRVAVPALPARAA